jgi:hypothetical protein
MSDFYSYAPEPVALPRPMKWREYVLWLLANRPELICTKAERAISNERHLRSLAHVRHGRLETPAEVADRLDMQHARAGAAQGLLAPAPVSIASRDRAARERLDA